MTHSGMTRPDAHDAAEASCGEYAEANRWADQLRHVAWLLEQAQAAMVAIRWDDEAEAFFNEHCALCDLKDHALEMDDHIADFKNVADVTVPEGEA